MKNRATKFWTYLKIRIFTSKSIIAHNVLGLEKKENNKIIKFKGYDKYAIVKETVRNYKIKFTIFLFN